MKLDRVVPYLKKTQRYINHVTHLFTTHFFHRKSANFAISEKTNIDCILVHNSFDFSRVFKGFFDKHGYNLDDVTKIGYSRPS